MLEIATLTVLLETGTTVLTSKFLEYGILGICVIVLAFVVKILHKRGEDLQDKILEMSNKNIEINGKVANALENNTDVLSELKTLMTNHVMEYKEDRQKK